METLSFLSGDPRKKTRPRRQTAAHQYPFQPHKRPIAVRQGPRSALAAPQAPTYRTGGPTRCGYLAKPVGRRMWCGYLAKSLGMKDERWMIGEINRDDGFQERESEKGKERKGMGRVSLRTCQVDPTLDHPLRTCRLQASWAKRSREPLRASKTSQSEPEIQSLRRTRREGPTGMSTSQW